MFFTQPPRDPHKFYETLGVPLNCDVKEIKAAYRKLVLEHHPDKKKGGTDEMFKKIQHAYEILSDAEKRQKYDTHGIVEGESPQHTNINDIIAEMMRTNMHHQQRQQAYRKPDDIIIDVEITMAEVYNGKKTEIFFERDVLVDMDNNTINRSEYGHIMHECNNCHGSGQVMMQRHMGLMIFQQSGPCPSCQGHGYFNVYPDKYKISTKKCKFNYKFPIGIPNGHVIKIDGSGHTNLMNPDDCGDVLMRISYESMPGFSIDASNNLIYTHKLSIFEAITGSKIYIRHPGSMRSMTILFNAPIMDNTRKIINNYGFPRMQGGESSHFIILFDIYRPVLSSAEMDILRANFAHYYTVSPNIENIDDIVLSI